ncbi:hypothetical protein AOQ84DRAFT_68296 [Glonium stellatum]|uniref:Uncharacterized protein n=1 Tax=Glonium stellatum TaxID=574774 RepID=A0A8E2JRE8_9PEZI|nr:hypothetical protein AOQ84DRAFT_68296 [Glonium stellatum]
MLGVAVLPCQIFLKETIIGSARYSSEKAIQSFERWWVRFGGICRKMDMIRLVRQEYRHTRCWLHNEGCEDWALGPVLASSSGIDRTAEGFRVDKMLYFREAPCFSLHDQIYDLAGRHLARNPILWTGAFATQATSLVAASNPQQPVPRTRIPRG